MKYTFRGQIDTARILSENADERFIAIELEHSTRAFLLARSLTPVERHVFGSESEVYHAGGDYGLVICPEHTRLLWDLGERLPEGVSLWFSDTGIGPLSTAVAKVRAIRWPVVTVTTV